LVDATLAADVNFFQNGRLRWPWLILRQAGYTFWPGRRLELTYTVYCLYCDDSQRTLTLKTVVNFQWAHSNKEQQIHVDSRINLRLSTHISLHIGENTR